MTDLKDCSQKEPELDSQDGVDSEETEGLLWPPHFSFDDLYWQFL